MINSSDVQKILDKVRPYLLKDGGDVELVSINEDNTIDVRLTGACRTCPLSMMTLRAGIERQLMLEIPAIKRVESVN
jgi:Fe-S cluster biogenesis protein NfuA